MKFGSINFPPRKKKDEAKEFIPAELPAPLKAGVILESPEQLKSAVEEYANSMNEYATQHDVFIAQEKTALIEASRNIAAISEKFWNTENPNEKKQFETEMRDALMHINGDLTEALKERILDNEVRRTPSTASEDFSESAFEKKGPIRAEELGTPFMEVAAKNREESQPLELTPANELPSDPTLKETKEGLRSMVGGVVSLEEERSKRAKPSGAEETINGKLETQREMTAQERAGMKEAEDAYFAAYKEHYAQKGAKESNEPEELMELKRAYDEKRIAYGSALTESARERLMSKHGSEMDPERMQTVLNRYNRLIRYNEIIKPTAEKRYAAKLEALGERPRGLFTKSLRWFGEQNKKLENRFGKVGARVVRATAVTAIAGALGVGLGTVSAGALLGWGAFRIGRSLATGFASMGIGVATGEVAGLALGAKRQRVLESAAYNYVGRTEAELTPEMLENYDIERQAFEKNVNETTLQNRKQIARAVGALVGGAGIGFLENLPSMQAGANEIAEHNLGISIDGKGTSGAELPGSVSHTGASSESLTPSAAGTHEQATAVSAAISKPGEGTDQLFVDLKEHIRANGMVSAGPQSAALKHLLETHPNALSRSMGSIYDGNGMKVHMGDQLTIDENQNVYFTPSGGKPQLFIQNDSTAPNGFRIHEITGPKPVAEVPIEKPSASVSDDLAPTPDVQPIVVPTTAAVPETVSSVPSVPMTSADTIAAPVSAPSTPAPENVPVTAPSPTEAPTTAPTPTPEVVPSEPSAPETVPVAPPISAEIFTNGHGVSIDPSSPHLYEMKGLKNVTELWGGTTESRDKFLETYFADPQNNDKTVWVTLDAKSTLTGKPVTMAFTAQGAGAIIVTNTKGDPIPPPDPNTFTKRIN